MDFKNRLHVSLAILTLWCGTAKASNQCQIIAPLPVPVSITGCTFSGTLPANSTSYIQNTLSPTTTGQQFSVQDSSVSHSETLGFIGGTQCLHAINGAVSGTGSDCGSGGGGGTWGSITGTLSNQTDLQAKFNGVSTSTNSLQTQITATGVSTGTLQTQITATGVSTGTLQTQITATAIATGTLASYFPVKIGSSTIGPFDVSTSSASVTGTGGLTVISSVTIGANAVYGFQGVNNGLMQGGNTTRLLAADGGAYFIEANGSIEFNSASFTMANGGTPYFSFQSGSTSGQQVITNGAGTAGVGLDITSDSLLRIRNRAFTDNSALVASTETLSGSLTVVSSITAPNFPVSISTGITGTLAVANGGTGTASPGLVAGTNITSITGTWPNQTINAATQSGGGGGASSLAVGTGTLSQFTNNVSSPTSILSANGAQFTVSLQGGSTAFLSLNLSSVTLQGPIVSSVAVNSINPQALQSATYPNITGVGAQTIALNMNSNLINNVTNPASAQDAATKNYVDSVAAGLDYKAACDLATTGALPSNLYTNGSSGVGAQLTGVSVGALTVDGQVVNTGQRILVKNEAAPADNGIYIVTTVGSGIAVYVLTRATDYNQSSEIQAGDSVFVSSGIVLAGTGWVQTTEGTITVGTTAIVWAQFGGPSGTTLSIANPTGNYVIGSTATVILADATNGSLTVTLPTVVGITGRVYRIKRLNSGANTVTIGTTGGQSIDGGTTQVLNAQYVSVDVISDGTQWWLQ